MKKAAQATPNLRLSREREQRGWSQQEVADHIGTTPVSVSRWERGLTTPSSYFRRKLCELFGKTAHELGLVEDKADNGSGQPVPEGSPTQAEPTTPSAGSMPLWNVPHRRNPFFTGREEVLQQLHKTLSANGTAALTQPQAITGLGGIGKTQTALEYAYRYRDEYQAVFWARADTRETLVSDLAASADLLRLSGANGQDRQRAVEALRRWMNEHSGWLLILDNADDMEIVNEFLPYTGTGHFILTTRAQATGLIAQNLELEQMEPDEGALFLLRRARLVSWKALPDTASVDWAKAREIAQQLGGLPLALDQAGAYIEETACGLAGYLDRYRGRRTVLLRRRGGPAADHPEPVAMTWSLSLERIKQTNAAAIELLQVCAFLHPDAIPEELLSEGAAELGAVLAPVAADSFELDAAIEALRRYSLLRRSSDTQTLSIHRLVQAVIVDQMDEQVQRQWAERAVRAVCKAFPEVKFDTWQRCQRALSQALACAALIKQWNLAFPEAAHLLNRAGNYLRERGRYREAEPLLKQALALYEQTVEPEHPDVAGCLHDLALLYWEQGDYTQAEPLYQQALAMREQTLGTDHFDVAQSLNDLALLYWNQGRYAQAESLFQKALTILEKVLGPEHPDVAKGLGNLALISWEQGKYTQAEPLMQRALAIQERVLEPEHPDVANSLNNLGRLYLARGKYAAAEPLLQRSLTILEHTLGPDHPFVAYGLNSLALLYQTQGRYAQAEPLYRRALRLREQAQGPENADVAIALDNLALLSTDQGHYTQAEPLFHRALTIREQVLGPAHPLVGRTLYRLARLSYLQGHYVQAEPLLARSLLILEQALGADHPHVASSLDLQALLSLAQGNSTQAEQLCQQALRIREQALGLEHLETATSLNTLAEIYFAQGKYDQVEPLLQRVLSIREPLLGPAHPEVVSCLQLYARLLRATGRQDEATQLAARIHRGQTAHATAS
ncbi:MAG TPA: FxSxx-COOH system tetratricopeptide repeat protein [Ktedonobacteraceae bacterium]|nr:FxSxx-COOH system tetratricopeptide repeat protein [Ktedonobacteraceae bacterium]